MAARAFPAPIAPGCPDNNTPPIDFVDLEDLIPDFDISDPPINICFDDLNLDFPLPIPFSPFGCGRLELGEVKFEQNPAHPAKFEVAIIKKNLDPCDLILEFDINIPGIDIEVCTYDNIITFTPETRSDVLVNKNTDIDHSPDCETTTTFDVRIPEWVYDIEIDVIGGTATQAIVDVSNASGVLTFTKQAVGGSGSECCERYLGKILNFDDGLSAVAGSSYRCDLYKNGVVEISDQEVFVWSYTTTVGQLGDAQLTNCFPSLTVNDWIPVQLMPYVDGNDRYCCLFWYQQKGCIGG
jgi:hypothetical protein